VNRVRIELWKRICSEPLALLPTRESQITGVIEATAGMYGNLQGIAGRSLQEINGLDHNFPVETKQFSSS